VDVASWIDDIAVGTKSGNHVLRAALPPGFSEGNLAALEDEPPSTSPRLATPALPLPTPLAAPPDPRSSPTRPQPVLVSARSEKRMAAPATLGVLVALLVVVAAGAAAWFTHLIPHP
jgi:hypothetical protein